MPAWLPLGLLLAARTAAAYPTSPQNGGGGVAAWTDDRFKFNREVVIEGGVPRAGPPRTSLLPFQLWGIAKQNLLEWQARARGMGYLTTPNLAAYGMQGLMWDAAQRMERKKKPYVPQPSDAMKVAKGIIQEGRLLADLSGHQRLGDHDKPPPGLPGAPGPPGPPPPPTGATGPTLPTRCRSMMH